jgi:hypothetical protein
MEETDHDKFLLKEYELCQDHVKHLDLNIWTTASIVGLGSIGSLALPVSSRIGLPELYAIAILVITVAWIWWAMASRWWDVQHASLIRMKHIEEELHLFRNRYIAFLDFPKDKRKDQTNTINRLSGEHIAELLSFAPDFHKGQVKGSIAVLPKAVTAIWIAYSILSTVQRKEVLLMQVIGTMSMTDATLIILAVIVFLGGLGIGVAIGFLLGRRSK